MVLKIAPSQKSVEPYFSVDLEFRDGTQKLGIFLENGEEAATIQIVEPTALIFRRADVYKSPTFENSCAIWAARSVAISAADKLRILTAMQTLPGGCMSIAAASLLVRAQGSDPIDVIARLVCDGDIVINVDIEMRPDSLLTASSVRPHFMESNSDPEGNKSHARPD